MESAVLKMKDAAAYCGLSYATFREYVQAEKVPAIRYPGKHGEPRRTKQFLRSDLDAFIAANRGSIAGSNDAGQPEKKAVNVAPLKRSQKRKNEPETPWYQRRA